MVLSLDRWVGKVAVVTGASSGIGANITEHLVENGLIVCITLRHINNNFNYEIIGCGVGA